MRVGSLFCIVALACRTSPEALAPAPPPDVPDVVATPDVAPDVPLPPSGPGVQAVVDRQATDAILGLVDGARETLDVCQFELFLTGDVVKVRDALVAAAKRGVKVRLLLDDEVESNPDMAAALVAEGIDAKVDYQDARVHAKIWVADGERVMIGSTNLSGASLGYNHETNVLVRDPAVVAFLAGWVKALIDDPSSHPKPVFPDPGAVNVAWREGGYLDVALPRIEAATTRIDLLLYGAYMDPKYKDGPVPDLAAALYAAAARGVPVRVVFEHGPPGATGPDQGNADVAEAFEAHGIDVRWDTTDVVTHAKMLLVDGAALVGSNNWGYGGIVLDHEAGVATSEEAAVQDFSDYFEERWAEATD